MNDKEQDVIEAARRCFGRTIDTETGETWMHEAIAMWMVHDLVDAVRRLDGYPPYARPAIEGSVT